MPTAAEWTAAAIPVVRQKAAEAEARVTLARQTADQLRRRQRAADDEQDSIRLAWKALRKTCPHPEDSYVPDPSGNSDSYYECNICGRQT